MAKIPLVSVIVPTYNRAKVVANTLYSALNQSIPDIEVIVVDDCSDDGMELERLLSNISDSRLKLVRHAVNMHGGAARNTGFDQAAGQYVALLDSDDIWEPNKLEECIKLCVEPRDVVYSKVITRAGVWPERPLGVSEAVGDYLVIHSGCMQSSALFMRTEFARSVKFNPDLKRFQDFDFALRLERAGANFVFCPEVLVTMRDDDAPNRISSGHDFRPGITWLETASTLSFEARRHFYFDRVVKLMAIGGELELAYEQMPDDIRASLTGRDKLLLAALMKLPSGLIPAVRRIRRKLMRRD